MVDECQAPVTSTSVSRRAFLRGVSALPLAAALAQFEPRLARAEGDGATLRWHGQGTTEINAEGKRFFIDAFFAQNPDGAPREEFDVLFLTHGHADHFGQTLELLQAFPDLKMLANSELVRNAVAWGLAAPEQVIDVNKGGKLVAGRTVARGAGAAPIPFPDIGVDEVLMVPADHTSSLLIPARQGLPSPPAGTFVTGGASVGYVIRFKSGFTLYHTGDTYLFDDMRLIGKRVRPDLALVPIGGNFTMDPVDAARAVVDLIRPRFVVPIHYATGAPPGTVSPALYGTPEAFLEALEGEDVKGLVLARGQELVLTGAGDTSGVRIA